MAEEFDQQSFKDRHYRTMDRLREVRDEFDSKVIGYYRDRVPESEDGEYQQRREMANYIRRTRDELDGIIDDLTR